MATYIAEYTQLTHGYRDPNTGMYVRPNNDPGTPASTKRFLSDNFGETVHYTTFKAASDAMNERIATLTQNNETIALNEYNKHQANAESNLKHLTLEEWVTETNNLYPVPSDPVIYKVEVVTK